MSDDWNQRRLGKDPLSTNGDGGESERLWGLPAGHILTESDANDLQNLISDFNDEIGRQADLFHDARMEVALSLGGEALVKMLQDKDERQVTTALQKVMQHYYESVRNARAKAS